MVVPIYFGLISLAPWESYDSEAVPLRWRHNGCDSVSNHQPRECLLRPLIRRTSKKTSKLRVTGLCAGNSPGTGEFSAQMASNAENVSIWWRHHAICYGYVNDIDQLTATKLRKAKSHAWLMIYITPHNSRKILLITAFSTRMQYILLVFSYDSLYSIISRQYVFTFLTWSNSIGDLINV